MLAKWNSELNVYSVQTTIMQFAAKRKQVLHVNGNIENLIVNLHIEEVEQLDEIGINRA